MRGRGWRRGDGERYRDERPCVVREVTSSVSRDTSVRRSSTSLEGCVIEAMEGGAASRTCQPGWRDRRGSPRRRRRRVPSGHWEGGVGEIARGGEVRQ